MDLWVVSWHGVQLESPILYGATMMLQGISVDLYGHWPQSIIGRKVREFMGKDQEAAP